MIGMNNFSPSAPKQRGGAPTVFCYLCSRPFGSKSISIHEKQCILKWHRENDKLPKNQRRNGPPEKPEIIKDSKGRVNVEATNELAWEASQAAMLQCDWCGRRFNPDRLAVHHRSCTQANPGKLAPGFSGH